MAKSNIMICFISLVTLLAFPTNSHAIYNANASGIVTEVVIYDTGSILFHIDNQPTTHPLCIPYYFSIDITNADYANRLLSRLVTAKATGETISIGYDNAGNCINNRIRTHRVG